MFADLVRAVGGGPALDAGCEPGHVPAYLRELGVDAFDIDLSPTMTDVARRGHPRLRFEVGSTTDLNLADASVAGLLAWWSSPMPQFPGSSRSSGACCVPDGARMLAPGRHPGAGPLPLGFHLGDASRLKTQGNGGHPMKVDVHRRPVLGYARADSRSKPRWWSSIRTEGSPASFSSRTDQLHWTRRFVW
ncbi:MAG TPA: methyltransferase domain-containing protein [Amycolatopsis sp.]|uniref:methyltransferase domain-containing protein n=1 Tax=Amycolatopsis sp. TaxID=37632 RepID=UPI002B4AA9D5|nr:methyltransferase domain-containing protein [Amycolatopsis sp.]HKS45431.1 methyltransferase domain-containing protein [Amycolatopsis sp.]